MLPYTKIAMGGGPSAQRSDLFTRVMLERFSVGLRVEPMGAEPVVSEIVAYCGRNLRFAAMEFSPHRTSRLVASAHGAPSRLLVSMQRSGQALVSQDGRAARIGPGQMFVLDTGRSFHIETTRMSTHSIYIDANAVRARAPGVDELTACAIDTRHGGASIFRAFADEMFRLGPALDDATADAIADSIPQVFAAALAGIPAPADDLGRLRRVLRRDILRCIEAHLHDPLLDVARIAEAVRLSPRRIYEVLAQEAESLMRQVWSMRLERCAAELRAEALRSRSIGQIAYGWGFSSVSHFSRAFRTRYGVTPSQWRKLLVASPVAVNRAPGDGRPPLDADRDAGKDCAART